MRFSHSNDIWRDYPELVPCALFVEGITNNVSVTSQIDKYYEKANARLANSSESELPEIQAWRRTFSKMGLKPTKYRCASEALLRRFKKEKSLPQIHPLIDLCNAISLAYAIPIAVFDISNVSNSLEVGYATGEETYLTFGGDIENPAPDEIVFRDEENKAHARRWTNRQSAYSAIRPETSSALIVAEALHDTATADIESLAATLCSELAALWSTTTPTLLSPTSPTVEHP